MKTHFNLQIQLPAFWKIRMADKNIKPHHVTLYINLLMIWEQQKDNPVLQIKAIDILRESNLGSRNLYFRYMRDLLKGGYIKGYRRGINGAIVEMKFLHDPAD